MAALLFFVVLAVSSQFLSVVNSAPQQTTDADMKEFVRQCNESFPINPEYLKKMNETGSFPDETDKTPKCFVRCMLMKNGFMDDAGNFDTDKLKQGYKDTQYPDSDAMVDTCLAQNTETQCMCNKAYLFAKCLMTQPVLKFERLEAEQTDDSDDDGGSIRETITNFFREAGGVVMTVLTILSHFRDILASALGGQ